MAGGNLTLNSTQAQASLKKMKAEYNAQTIAIRNLFIMHQRLTINANNLEKKVVTQRKKWIKEDIRQQKLLRTEMLQNIETMQLQTAAINTRSMARKKAISSFTSLLKQSTMVIGAGALAFGGLVAVTSSFNKTLVTTMAIGKLTTNQMNELGESANTYAKKWGIAANDIVSAQRELVKSGLEFNEIMTLQESVVMAAVGNNIEMAGVAETLVFVLKAFNKEASESNLILSQMQVAANESIADMSDFSELVKYSGGVAALTNMEFTELISLFGALSNVAQEGGIAARGLNRAFIEMIKEDPSATYNDLIVSLKGAGENTEILEEVIGRFSIRSSRAILGTIQGFEDYQRILGEVEHAQGEVGRVAETSLLSISSFLARIKETFFAAIRTPEIMGMLTGALEDLLITIEALAPVIAELFVKFAVTFIDALPPILELLSSLSTLMNDNTSILSFYLKVFTVWVDLLNMLPTGVLEALIHFYILNKTLLPIITAFQAYFNTQKGLETKIVFQNTLAWIGNNIAMGAAAIGLFAIFAIMSSGTKDIWKFIIVLGALAAAWFLVAAAREAASLGTTLALTLGAIAAVTVAAVAAKSMLGSMGSIDVPTADSPTTDTPPSQGAFPTGGSFVAGANSPTSFIAGDTSVPERITVTPLIGGGSSGGGGITVNGNIVIQGSEDGESTYRNFMRAVERHNRSGTL